MGERLIVDNPFYDGNASASAFGWQFQVDAAIFLFLYYLDEVEQIIVEGKYQDIELLCKNNKRIFAQAKSIQNGSLDNRTTKLEDAVISLAKTPADTSAGDRLLYISNYEAPIKRSDLFKNDVVQLKNIASEKAEFKKQLKKITTKLKKHIDTLKPPKRTKYQDLLRRLESIDVDNFMISTIYPYINTENRYGIFKEIEQKINEILTIKFDIQSPYIQKFVRDILLEWHTSFLVDATIPDNNKSKTINKEELLWQIVIVLSNVNIDMSEVLEQEIEADLIDEYESYYAKQLYIHQRFSFFNTLVDDSKTYIKNNPGKNSKDFIKDQWKNYTEEFAEFVDYSELAKEYLIKKSLYRLLNNKNNIKKIVERS